jgi:hypothetical protein
MMVLRYNHCFFLLNLSSEKNPQKRTIVETDVIQCDTEKQLIDTLLRGIRLNVNLKEQSELDCRRKANTSSSSLYVLLSTKVFSSLKLDKNDIVKSMQKSSSKFAIKILSIRRIGAYVTLECVSLSELDKLKRFSIVKEYAYLFTKTFGYDINNKGASFGRAQVTFNAKPTLHFDMNATVDEFWYFPIGVTVNEMGIEFGLDLGVDAYLKFNVSKEQKVKVPTRILNNTIIAKFAIPVVPVLGIIIPGTVSVSLMSELEMNMILDTPIDINITYSKHVKFSLPFQV